MAKGSWAATSASTVLVAANEYRDQLVIQKTTNIVAVALGIGEAAEAGKGIQLTNIGDVVIIRGAQSRMAIYMIGNTGAGTYQDGNIEVYPGPLEIVA